jgi:hypothetical protein
MNKIQLLKTEIEKIPEKRNRAHLVGVLENYNTKTNEAFKTLTQTRNSSDFILQVSSDINIDLVKNKIEQAAKISQRLRKRLSEDIEKIKSADDKFIDIKNIADSASKTLDDKWQLFLKGKIETYEKIVEAASGAGLSGSEVLAQTLNKLHTSLDSPPKSEEEATNIAEALNNLSGSIESLGLKGKVGEFLTAAAAGNATAQMLLQEEVQEFIEQNNLWSAFSIKLG